MFSFINILIKIFKVASSSNIFIIIIVCQLLSSFLVIIGLPLFIPVIEMMSGSQNNSLFANYIFQLFYFFNVEPTFNNLLFISSFLIIFSFIFDIFTLLLAQYNEYDLCKFKYKELIKSYKTVNWNWLVTHPSGEMNHALLKEAAAWSGTVFASIDLIKTCLQAISFISIALILSPLIFLLTVLIVSIIFYINFNISKKIKQISRHQNEEQYNLAVIINNIQQNKKLIKFKSLGEYFIFQFNNTVNKLINFAKINALKIQSQQVISLLGVFTFLISLIYFHKQLNIHYSSLIIIITAFTRILPLINKVSASYAIYSRDLAIFESLNKRLEILNNEKEFNGNKIIENNVNIDFKNLSFSFPNGKVVFDNINLVFENKKVTQIIGKSGEGKSTIIDLMTGLWRPSAGELNYNNISYKDIDYLKFRDSVSYVTQESTFFSGTILENLCFERELDEKNLFKILEITNLKDEINSMPKGLETLIGENGLKISGGQKQRLSIARALVKKPNILLLDEATSALDSANETLILNNIFSEFKNKITIVCISHSKEITKYADKKYFIENKKVKLI